MRIIMNAKIRFLKDLAEYHPDAFTHMVQQDKELREAYMKIGNANTLNTTDLAKALDKQLSCNNN